MKMFGIGFYYYFFLIALENFITFCKTFLLIFEKGVSIETGPSPSCVCLLLWSLFALSFCLQTSKKSVSNIRPIFLKKYRFLKN